jgi:hypothetical protein
MDELLKKLEGAAGQAGSGNAAIGGPGGLLGEGGFGSVLGGALGGCVGGSVGGGLGGLLRGAMLPALLPSLLRILGGQTASGQTAMHEPRP